MNCDAVTAVQCGAPPVVENGLILNVTSLYYGGIAYYGCQSGFIFGDLTNTQATCQENGVWTTPTVCQGLIVAKEMLASQHLAMFSISAYLQNKYYREAVYVQVFSAQRSTHPLMELSIFSMEMVSASRVFCKSSVTQAMS